MVEIKRNENETTAGALRRFTKKVKQSGILRQVRKLRFRARKLSEFKTRKNALLRIGRRKKVEKLQKLGKIKKEYQNA